MGIIGACWYVIRSFVYSWHPRSILCIIKGNGSLSWAPTSGQMRKKCKNQAHVSHSVGVHSHTFISLEMGSTPKWLMSSATSFNCLHFVRPLNPSAPPRTSCHVAITQNKLGKPWTQNKDLYKFVYMYVATYFDCATSKISICTPLFGQHFHKNTPI